MYPAVQAEFWSFTKALEGYVRSMYVDVKDLVTTGVGNLIDPLPLALGLPWVVLATGARATATEITAEWHAVKEGRIPAHRGQRPLALTDDDVRHLVDERLQHNESYLARRWASWGAWPADAQLGAHSIAWAAGAAWRAPHFDALAEANTAPGWALVAGKPSTADHGQAWLRDEGNPGLRKRNLENKMLFLNASHVLAKALPRDRLYYPRSVP